MKMKIPVYLIITLLITMVVSPVSGIKNFNETNMEEQHLIDNQQVALTSGEDVDWWPMFHHDPQHTGVSTSQAPETNNLLWSFDAGGGCWESPAIADDKVFFCCDKKYGNNVLYCLDASDGSKIWSFEPANIDSNPAVVDGRVYFGSTDKNVYCLDASDGSLIWNYETGNVVTTAPTVVDGKVYVISFTDRLYCLDTNNGDLIWDFQNSYLTGGSSPAVWNGKVYFGAFDGKIRCLDASDGSSIWTYSASSEVESAPTIVDGRVYIGSYYHMHCLDALNGNLKWKYLIPGEGVIYSCPTVVNNRVYFGVLFFEGGKFICLDASNGAVKWMFDGGALSPAFADGAVFFGGSKLYCVDASNGALIWSYDENKDFVGSPAIADGKVYVGTDEDDGKLYVIGDPNPIQIKNIRGGLMSVTATLENTHMDTISDIEWNISVTGGLLNMVNAVSTNTIGNLSSGETEKIRTDSLIFGLGRIRISVTVRNAFGSQTTSVDGFVLMFLVIATL